MLVSNLDILYGQAYSWGYSVLPTYLWLLKKICLTWSYDTFHYFDEKILNIVLFLHENMVTAHQKSRRLGWDHMSLAFCMLVLTHN